jgi:PAS domain S-box-containing protein
MAQVSNQNMTGAAAKTGGVRPNILIVDDRRENLLATEKILRHLEADIFKANSGNEALSLLLRHRFALVLLDVQMPDMDGFETAMLMQEHESMRGVPIIFVTAISKEERYATRAAEIGAVDYIFKPINSEILRSKVKVYLDLYVQREELFTIQSALGDAEARLRAILDNVLDGIITIDGNGTVISINPAVVKMFGYEAAEVIEHNIRMLMPEPNRGNHDGYLARYESTGKTRAIGIGRELEGLTKQGITFPMELTVTEVAFQGQRMFVGLVRDITERKRSEDASRRARAAAEVANRTKSDFLANMSHEIRTPMNAIMGMTYLALRAAPSPQQHGYLTKIGHAAQSLLGIMNDILDFSKIEAGKLEMEHIAFSLDEVLLRNLVDIVGQKAEEKGIALEFSVVQETPRFLIGDPLRLGQVLINLVNNAIKFTDQGKILVKVQADERTLDRVRLQFSVSDTGIGISPDQMENLFQSFNQGDSSFTRKYGGTGLGLAISKQLCELMGGSIAAESELGKGSIFRFTADFGIAGDELPRVARESRGPSLTRNVLIVDDSESARSVLLAMLQANSFLARAVSSGEEALSALTRGSQVGHPFDLVLMDWRLPGIDGIEASRRIMEPDDLGLRIRRGTERPQRSPLRWLSGQAGRRATADAHHRLDPCGACRWACSHDSVCAGICSSRTVRAAHSRGRRQRDQPRPGERAAGRSRYQGRDCGQRSHRRGSGLHGGLRSGADGYSDAGDGWIDGDQADPLEGALPPASHHCHDRPCHAGRSRTQPRCGHERPSHQADQSRVLDRHAPAMDARTGGASMRARRGCGKSGVVCRGTPRTASSVRYPSCPCTDQWQNEATTQDAAWILRAIYACCLRSASATS